jgi:hypothetical protein
MISSGCIRPVISAGHGLRTRASGQTALLHGACGEHQPLLLPLPVQPTRTPRRSGCHLESVREAECQLSTLPGVTRKWRCRVESSGAGRWNDGAVVNAVAAVLGDQAKLPRPGDGLGAIGRAELVQDVADVLLDGVEGDHELSGDGPV